MTKFLRCDVCKKLLVKESFMDRTKFFNLRSLNFLKYKEERILCKDCFAKKDKD